MGTRVTAYVTWQCECKRKATDGISLHPRYCGNGRPVLKLKPARYRRTWPDIIVATERASFPAPTMMARPATADEIPNGARVIAELARANGWNVAVTISRGQKPHATTGRPGPVKTFVLVRAQRDGARVGAQWENGKGDEKTRKIRHPDGRVADLSDAELRTVLRTDSLGG